MIESAEHAYRGTAATAGLRLVVECDPPLRAVPLRMDAGRIGQVISNFLSNAIKFTPAGGTVSLRATVVSAPPSRGSGTGSAPERWTVRVDVRDTGHGLGPAELSRLFQPYTQIRAAEMQAGCVAARRAPHSIQQQPSNERCV